jgi:tetratricopeptide (TPR) repeat protein
MKPYSRSLALNPGVLWPLVFSLVVSLTGAAFSSTIPKTTKVHEAKSSLSDLAVRKAFDRFYSLEYDRSILEFERILELHRDDPFAVNHLLQAVIFRELYRLNLLDTTLYAHDGFLSGKGSTSADAKVRDRTQKLADLAIHLCDQRLRENPNDVDALYARGVTRGLRATYMALVDKSFFAALRNAVGARNDHEKVLQLDPIYTDAKTVVGIHHYVIGSLPFPVKMLAGIAGMSGNKKKGLEYLAQASKSGAESRVDARVALALFLRREGKYPEALAVVDELTAEHPHNYLFALEACNLLKDAGRGPDAIQAYRKLLDGVKAEEYPQAHPELAAFGLAESLRGQKDYEGALSAYEMAGGIAEAQPGMKQRAALAAGQMNDLLKRREEAVKQYQSVISFSGDSDQAEMARKFMRDPYHAE